MINEKAILFDLDGTLLDTQELILSSFRYATREILGEQLPDEVILPFIGIPLAYQMQTINAEHADELMVSYREHNARVHDELIQYFEGTRETLDELREEYGRLAVVTSKRLEPAQKGLERFDLQGYFEFIIGSEETTKHKPEPEPLLLAAKRFGTRAEHCIYVGDSPYDMMAARAAGCVALAAPWGMFTRDELANAGAQHYATTISELPTVIRDITF
jgi:pyrophosphatase PpaX